MQTKGASGRVTFGVFGNCFIIINITQKCRFFGMEGLNLSSQLLATCGYGGVLADTGMC